MSRATVRTNSRSTFVVAVLAAATLTLGACSSADTASDTTPTGSTSVAASDTQSDGGDAQTTASGASDATTDDGVGDTAAGSLDAQTSAWFTAACTGLTPMGDMLASVLGVGMQLAMATGTDADSGAKAKELQQQLVDALDSAGTSLTSTQQSLANLPAPTIENGDQIAAAFDQFLAKTGPQLSEVAKEVAASPATDTASLSAALQKIQALGAEGTEGADVLDQVDPETQAAIEALPACAAMQDALGGLLGGPTTAN